jgi:hypothetical protein
MRLTQGNRKAMPVLGAHPYGRQLDCRRGLRASKPATLGTFVGVYPLGVTDIPLTFNDK